jgi:hypothetical protein
MKKRITSYTKTITVVEIRIEEVIDFYVKINPIAHYLLVD